MKRKLSLFKIVGLTIINVCDCMLKVGFFSCAIFGVLAMSYFYYNHVLLDMPPVSTYFECKVIYNGTETDILSCTELKITDTNKVNK